MVLLPGSKQSAGMDSTLIHSDFENYVVEGNILIKGRVYLFVVLIIGIKVFFDKNIRKVIDMFRKEVVVNEQ